MQQDAGFDILKAHFGTHSAAARAMGLDPRVYRRWRTTGRMASSVKELVRLKALEVITLKKEQTV
jgi:hypothetical protein